MKGIQMVDLKGQYIKIKSEIDAAIQNVIQNTAFINGPEVKSFKSDLERYLDGSHVIPCANGTDALQIAMMALQLKPGDEVITADFTYVATAEVIGLLGLKPVLVDVKPDTFTIDPELVAKAITSKTRAIVPVHLFGQCADMETLNTIADLHNLYIIEDNAQAIGGTYTFSDGRTVRTGSMGQLSCTSFFPSKNLGCYGDGGAMFTNDDALAERLRMIANHGQKTRYYHEMVGCNSRLDAMQAAILRVKLPHLDSYCDARRAAADFYDNAFANNPKITTPFRAANARHVFHQYTLKLNGVNRDEVNQKLADRDIPSMIYYPVPCHKQEMLKAYNTANADLPVTNMLQDCVISLPMHTELTNEELTYIANNLLEIVG